ncbi:MAG: RseA family anti-sigma factor [Oleiphilaceae bacterium]|nr:RseA family anti-sigma factor [Oleiphilaceae bacterium]
MQDHEREILSAMMDDQADSQAVSQVLNGGSPESIQAQWYRWHRLRDLLQGGNPLAGPTSAPVDVRHGVSQALDRESGGIPDMNAAARSAGHD